MLEVGGLSVTYGAGPGAVHALGPLSFALEEGGTCAVIGPSGCGKSTLLHALCGVLPGHAGSVRWKGRAVDPGRLAIGFIPQDFGLLPWKTVRQNCLLPYRIKRLRPDEAALRRHRALAERLGIGDIQDRYPNELSGSAPRRPARSRCAPICC